MPKVMTSLINIWCKIQLHTMCENRFLEGAHPSLVLEGKPYEGLIWDLERYSLDYIS